MFPPPTKEDLRKAVKDHVNKLAAITNRLAVLLRKADPGNCFAEQALDFLKIYGLQSHDVANAINERQKFFCGSYLQRSERNEAVMKKTEDLNKPFRLELAAPLPGDSICLNLPEDTVFGGRRGQMDYGHLFAYLFRRFGYPNAGWDDYKQLAKYRLTTPEPDMILVAHPSPTSDMDLHFSFAVPSKRFMEAENWPWRLEAAWHERLLDWVEANEPVPDWMQAVAAEFSVDGWRTAFRYLPLYADEFKNGEPEGTWYAWHKEVSARYEAVEPRPAREERAADMDDWPDEDPLKRYALAARAALEDLGRPVAVRDQYIDAYGMADPPPPPACPEGVDEDQWAEEWYEARRELDAEVAPAAGYPSGSLGNTDPQGFADLCDLARQLGGGDARKGIAMASAALRTALGQAEQAREAAEEEAALRLL